jgi:hypothetical protein
MEGFYMGCNTAELKKNVSFNNHPGRGESNPELPIIQ